MLLEVRKMKGISQAELSRKSGIPQGVISYIESGRTKSPRIDTMLAIAKALDCTIDELTMEGGQTDGAAS